MRTIEIDRGAGLVRIIDQTKLPVVLEHVELMTLDAAVRAIADMQVRGAPLIGVTAAAGLWLAMKADPSDEALARAATALIAARPTAVNLKWAVDLARTELAARAPGAREEAASMIAHRLAEEDVLTNHRIGEHGKAALLEVWEEAGRPNPFVVMTHCNAGWLATVSGGTALAPVYALFANGHSLEVIVSETRPRNQGQLTAWELREAGIPYRYVADNACGHLLQSGDVHAVIVGCDRLARNGDVCNKVGTYLKALAARDNDVPFFAAVPSSTVDLATASGREIEIELRSPLEVSDRFNAQNPAFDVTPARLVTAIITDVGVCPADEASLVTMMEKR